MDGNFSMLRCNRLVFVAHNELFMRMVLVYVEADARQVSEQSLLNSLNKHFS